MAAFEEIKRACHKTNSNLQQIAFHKLDFDHITATEPFYGADVAIVDLSIPNQQHSLFYRIGNRENFGMKHNILIFNDDSLKVTIPNLPISNLNRISYRVSSQDKRCYVTEPVLDIQMDADNANRQFSSETKILLSTRIRNALQEVEIQAKAHIKEKFLADLKQARESQSGDELVKTLNEFRRKLSNPSLISSDIIYNLLVSFREVQDYDSMVGIIEELQPCYSSSFTSLIRYMYAFALSRRNLVGDREKALETITGELNDENTCMDIICLAGRIYKDKFIESNYVDEESLNLAIKWYRKGFDRQPNEYAGINLATLLVIKGNELNNSPELQNIASILNILIGRKGSLRSLIDYWDVATFFEISVLAENYTKAIDAAQFMFNLKPPAWYLKSTISNIKLINEFRRKNENEALSPEEHMFQFWMEFFIDAAKDTVDTSHLIHFPVIILEDDKTSMPSYITVNLDDQDGKSLQITNVCRECFSSGNTCKRPHKWLLHASQIRGVR